MADFPFVNESSQSERRQILENDRKISSYMAHAAASVDDDRGGRYAAIEKSATVVGASPISYPQQPTNSPWARDPVPDEPPLGFSVEDHDPVGEPHELALGDASTVPGNASPRTDTVEDAAAAATVARHPVAVAVKSRGRRRM